MISEETFTAKKMFIIIQLLQRGEDENSLKEKGYSLELINKAQEIRNYLFVCFRNLGERRLKNE